jgi:hypothetical protein
MTTILKALQELERRDSHFVRSGIPSSQDDRPRRWGVLSVSILALLGATIGVASLLRGRAAPSAGSRDASSAERRSVVAPPAPVVQQVVPPAPVVQKVAPPEPRAVAPQTSSAKDDTPKGRAAKAQPAPPPRARQPATPKENTATRQAKPPGKAPAPEPAAGNYPMVPAQPRVQLKAIVYAENASDSTATLRINGERAVTLHEGDSIGGVEVQLILPDTVYLHYGGNVFTISLVP